MNWGAMGKKEMIGCSVLTGVTHTHPTPTNPTGGLPLTSPKTNEEIDPAQALLFPNMTLRTLVIEYKEEKKRE